jgi:hypothetical protein
MYENILITAISQKFVKSCMTMIHSVHKYSMDTVEQIYVYNLGLSPNKKLLLNKFERVTVVDIDPSVNNIFPGYLNPSNYAFKIYCLWDAKKYGKNVFWLDSGALFLKNCKEIYDFIKNDDFFCVQDRDPNTNRKLTHKKAQEIMNATNEELDSVQLCAGIIGYKVGGKYNKLIDEAFHYSCIQDCICGSKEDHRHDQSILSILTYRYHCPRHDMNKYGEIYNFVESCRSNNVVIYVHRNSIHMYDGIKIKK